MSSTTDRCYYADPAHCSGDLWQCVGCGESFCSEGHFHQTAKGYNVECVACERERKDAELLGAGSKAEAKARRIDLTRLDIRDK